MKIFLIGLPGSGKSTIGPKLADDLGIRFYDLDEEIIKEENISIAEIFDRKGEDYFRVKENDVLHKLVAKTSDFVLATGGGTPCYKDAMAWMNNKGLTIFLDIPIEVLVERVSHQAGRPLLSGNNHLEKLNILSKQRRPLYIQSKISWSQEKINTTIEQLSMEVLQAK